VTEALVFGRRAGRSAAARTVARTALPFRTQDAAAAVDLITCEGAESGHNSADLIQRLQAVMADDVGPFRTAEKLARAIARIEDLTVELGERPFGDGGRFDMRRIDWFDLRNMLLVARVVALAALRRTESRGAHQREDFPGMVPEWRVNQTARLRDGGVDLVSVPPAHSPGVFAGPDLAIHPPRDLPLRAGMGPRVKPAGDERSVDQLHRRARRAGSHRLTAAAGAWCSR
jgi:succinate dehydrogenase/fumarate reductase flavoprotein subunit